MDSTILNDHNASPVPAQLNCFPGAVSAFEAAVLNGDLGTEPMDLHLLESEHGGALFPQHAVDRRFPLVSIPQVVGRRKIIELAEADKYLPELRLGIFAGESACSITAAQPFQKGSLGVGHVLGYFSQGLHQLKPHARKPLLACDCT